MDHSRNYTLLPFNADTIARTEDSWLQELETAPDTFPGDVRRFIEFAKSHMDYGNKGAESLAYGVFDEGEHVADSIVEVIITKPGKVWVKMLDCFVRPSISEKASSLDLEAVKALIAIYVASIVGMLALGNHHKAALVKFYGRSGPLLDVLILVEKSLNEFKGDLRVKAKIEGRWLVVKPVKKES